MSEGTALHERRRIRRLCRHHWVIETPHGATSRGLCKRCGTTKRFPNAAEDALLESGNAMGRWARSGVARPTQLKPAKAQDN